jgi:hypothetical protein
MTIAPENRADAIEPVASTNSPFYRRPLVLIVAGAIVVVLVIAGIATAALLNAKPVLHVASAATSDPVAPTRTPRATPTQTPTQTPTPTPSLTQPQAAAPAPAPAAPVAPVAPPAAPVTPPVGTAPIYGVVINSFSAVTAAGEHCPLAATATDYFHVVVTWSTANGDLQVIKDTSNNINPGGPAFSEVGPSGSRTVKQYCDADGGVDDYRITVSTTRPGANPNSITTDDEVESHFSN